MTTLSPTPKQHRSDRSSFPFGGVVLLALGIVFALSNMNVRIPEQAWSAMALMPLALAGLAARRAWMQTGRVPMGIAWWIFGSSFAALAGLQGLLGWNLDLLYTWMVPVGFIVIGLSTVLRRR